MTRANPELAVYTLTKGIIILNTIFLIAWYLLGNHKVFCFWVISSNLSFNLLKFGLIKDRDKF